MKFKLFYCARRCRTTEDGGAGADAPPIVAKGEAAKTSPARNVQMCLCICFYRKLHLLVLRATQEQMSAAVLCLDGA